MRFQSLVLLFLMSGASASTEIAGGIVSNQLPSVVQINDCTGIFISSRAILSAAHCFSNESIVLNQKFTKGQVFLKQKSISANGLPEPTFVKALISGTVKDDLAIVILPKDKAVEFSPIATQAPQVLELVHLVGFGANKTHSNGKSIKETGEGVKRIGTNEVFDVSAQSIMIRGVFENESGGIFDSNATLAGDSGGPLLNSMGEVMGILSGWAARGGPGCVSAARFKYLYVVPDLGCNEEISVYNRIDLPENQEWIKSILSL